LCGIGLPGVQLAAILQKVCNLPWVGGVIGQNTSENEKVMETESLAIMIPIVALRGALTMIGFRRRYENQVWMAR
jgi:hypothetical protein